MTATPPQKPNRTVGSRKTAAYHHATVETGHHRLVGHRLWCRCRVQATEHDVAVPGLSAAEVSRGLSVLERYRIMGLPPESAAGDAARRLFNHGRGGDAWTVWLRAGSAEPAAPTAGFL
jgi:hypothetical protein